MPALSSLARTSDSKGRYALKAEAAAGRWAARPAHGECGGMQNNVPPLTLLATMISTDQLLSRSPPHHHAGVYSPMKNLTDATGYPGGNWQVS